MSDDVEFESKEPVCESNRKFNMFEYPLVKLHTWQYGHKWQLCIDMVGFEVADENDDTLIINTFKIPIMFDSYQEALARGIMFVKQMNLTLISPSGMSENFFETYSEGSDNNHDCVIVKFEAFQDGVFLPQHKMIHLNFGNETQH